jgi:AcrR family transcriptional regulator
VTVVSADPSAAPRRERGVRSRAGNAMDRTRTAVLDGAGRAVEKYGARKATMADIAMLAGVAKGTLYNHFRTKEAVYAAAIDVGIDALTTECSEAARDDLAEALARAAERLGSHPALRRIAADEPALLADLVRVGSGGSWDRARSGIAAVLTAADRSPDPASVDLVLRWLASCLAEPAGSAERQAALLAAALGDVEPSTPQLF